MRPRLEATNIGIMDLADQPESRYVLIVDGILGTKAAFAVDDVRDQHGMFEATRFSERHPVVCFPYDTRWALVHRTCLVTATVEEWERKRAVDNTALNALGKELYPQIGDERGDQPVVVGFPLMSAGKSDEPGLGQYL